MATALKIFIITDEVIVGFLLPKWNDLFRQAFVDRVRGEGFPAMKNAAQIVSIRGKNNCMHMVGHDNPASQLVSLPVEKAQCPGNNPSHLPILQETTTVPRIKIGVNAI